MITILRKSSGCCIALASILMLLSGWASPVCAQAASDELKVETTTDAQGHWVDKTDYPFVNDPRVIGQWVSVDFVDTPEQFNPNKKQWQGDLFFKGITFLPNGGTDAGYIWTRGLVLDTGSKIAPHYMIKEIGGQKFLFYEWKSGDYTMRHQKPSWYVLQAAGGSGAEAQEIKVETTTDAQGHWVDKTDYPFVTDLRVIGQWESIDFVREPDQFKPNQKQWRGDLFFKGIAFYPNGSTSISRPWTRGLVLDRNDHLAAHYTIKEIGGNRFLFFEWKTGDYSIRHSKPSWYVLRQVSGGATNTSRSNQDSESNFETKLSATGKLEIAAHPGAADYAKYFDREKLKALPAFNAQKSGEGGMWQVDMRSRDLSALNVSGRLADLMHADFDSKTKWPSALPAEFVPTKIMELGKNPGLGVRDLHKKGITGKGVGIAIIDQALLTDHVEYKDRLKLYEHIRWSKNSEAQMHGPAVASIAVGKTVGVAPEADLYFIAEWHMKSGRTWYLTPMAKSIDRIIEINKTLPKENRIRVISISLGIDSFTRAEGYNLVKDAIKNAEASGIYVAYVGSNEFIGLGRDSMQNPNSTSSYDVAQFLKSGWRNVNGQILVPMDSRCVASPTGNEDYVFYNQGGMSWTVPWVAGMYALACQVKPDVTPKQFWDAARTTGRNTTINIDGKPQEFGLIINPEGLLKELTR